MNYLYLIVLSIINSEIIYCYVKNLLITDLNKKKHNHYWYIKIYSIVTLLISYIFYNELWYMFYLFASIMLIIIYYDYLERIIPNDIILGLLFIVPLYHYFNNSLSFSILWGTLPAFFFLALGLLMQGSIGMGDIKLYFVLGLFFTVFEMFYIVMLSSLIAIAFYCFELLVLREGKDNTLAYGPYIMLSIFLINFF